MLIGVTINKSTLFRGVQQDFYNTYYYRLPSAITAPSEGICDEIVATERKLHSTAVQFKRAQVWTAGGTKAQNQMIFQKNYTGAGLGVASVSMDRERAVLVRCPAGFDVRGLPVYFRKYYHSCGNVQGSSINVDGILANTQEIGATDRTLIAGIAQENKHVGGAETWEITSKNLRSPTGDFQCHKYLEHHQLGDMWR